MEYKTTKMKNVKRFLSIFSISIICIMFVSLSLLFGSGCKNQKEKRNVIASVGNTRLSVDEIMIDAPPRVRSGLTSFEIKEYALRWINNEVLYQEALNRELEKGDEFKNEFIKLKKELLISKLIEQTLENQITVTDEEIESYFKNNSDEFILAEGIVHAYHVLVEKRTAANAIRSRLNKGEAFDEIVKETYKDSLSTENWDLGYFSKDEIIPEISKIVFDLQVGKNSNPIKTEFGYHVVKLVDKQKKGEIKKLELVENEIRLKLETQKKEAYYQRFLLRMKSNFKIQTNFQLLESIVLDSLIRIGD